MDWDDLRVFLAVARAGQFVAAARALRVDHATAARRVGALERALETRLFERRTTGVSLTEAGERLLAAAERAETAILGAEAELGSRDVALSGTVRIGAPDGLSTFYLAGVLAGLAERHPDIAVQLVPSPQAGPVGRREVDIAVALEKPEGGRFVARKLTDYSLGLYASAAYLAGHPAPADAAGLAAHRLVGYVDEFSYSPALSYVAELCGPLPVLFQCAGAVGQLEAVRAGAGVGALHDFIARRHPDLVRVLPGRRAERAYWLVAHEDTRGIGRIRAVHDLIVDAVARDRAIFVAR